MTDMREQTIETYNNSAGALAEYFRGIGPRQKYIDLAFEQAGNPEEARVFEIGCGDGRDASAIIKKASWYEGIDASDEMIKLAHTLLPDVQFEVADAVEFSYPNDLDIVFAFASILHLNKSELQTVLGKVEVALNPGGVFYISSKWRPTYQEEVKEDRFGKRLFYFYNVQTVAELAGQGFEIAKTFTEIPAGHTKWFELALRKL